MTLCYQCREYITKKYGSNAFFPPFQHCHHDLPEEYPCWWCEELEKLRLCQSQTLFLTITNLLQLDRDNPKCPICGKGLK